ncbi:MAG TPA: hypothetical protein VE287_00815, partial [Actinopolymorphaceae bacterium]|nr:hypothetical protein [Actinopolymorphaceae bacterium]
RHSMQVATRRLTEDALDTLVQSVQVFERIDAQVELAYSLAALAHFRSEQERGGEALALAARAVRAAGKGGHRPGYASAVREYGSLLAQHERYAEALPLLDESLELARELGGPVDVALVLHRITRHALENSDLDRATEASRASLEAVVDVPDVRARAYIAAMASRVASTRGDGHEAVDLAERARDEFVKLGDRLGELAATASLAEAHLEVGGAVEVVRIAEVALPAYADVGATRHEERLRRARDAAREQLARQR